MHFKLYFYSIEKIIDSNRITCATKYICMFLSHIVVFSLFIFVIRLHYRIIIIIIIFVQLHYIKFYLLILTRSSPSYH